jgi:calcium/calmodulin-dependent protein kinase (CaM kinase) II
MSTADEAAELVKLNQQLLDAIAAGDWAVYHHLCDETISAFEPEANGHLIEGLPFHKFYFDLKGSGGSRTTTMSQPHVRLMGDVAVLSYIRLVQRQSGDEAPTVSCSEETRVWQRRSGQWKHVHFHRSIPS